MLPFTFYLLWSNIEVTVGNGFSSLLRFDNFYVEPIFGGISAFNVIYEDKSSFVHENELKSLLNIQEIELQVLFGMIHFCLLSF